MTDVCFELAQHVFPRALAAAEPLDNKSLLSVRAAPPRCAIHGNETFIARGTPAADLEALFGQYPK